MIRLKNGRMNFLATDELEWEDDETLEALYVLDMWEINNLTDEALQEEKQKLLSKS